MYDPQVMRMDCKQRDLQMKKYLQNKAEASQCRQCNSILLGTMNLPLWKFRVGSKNLIAQRMVLVEHLRLRTKTQNHTTSLQQR